MIERFRGDNGSDKVVTRTDKILKPESTAVKLTPKNWEIFSRLERFYGASKVELIKIALEFDAIVTFSLFSDDLVVVANRRGIEQLDYHELLDQYEVDIDARGVPEDINDRAVNMEFDNATKFHLRLIGSEEHERFAELSPDKARMSIVLTEESVYYGHMIYMRHLAEVDGWRFASRVDAGMAEVDMQTIEERLAS